MLIAAMIMAMQAPTSPAPLELVCMGGGTANKPVFGTVNSQAHGSGMIESTAVTGSGYSTSTVTGMRQQDFADQVHVRLF